MKELFAAIVLVNRIQGVYAGNWYDTEEDIKKAIEREQGVPAEAVIVAASKEEISKRIQLIQVPKDICLKCDVRRQCVAALDRGKPYTCVKTPINTEGTAYTPETLPEAYRKRYGL